MASFQDCISLAINTAKCVSELHALSVSAPYLRWSSDFSLLVAQSGVSTQSFVPPLYEPAFCVACISGGSNWVRSCLWWFMWIRLQRGAGQTNYFSVIHTEAPRFPNKDWHIGLNRWSHISTSQLDSLFPHLFTVTLHVQWWYWLARDTTWS